MKHSLIISLILLAALSLNAGTQDANTTVALSLLQDSKADALQRSMIGLELGGQPPSQQPNVDGDKATYTYRHEGLNATVWTYKGTVYVIKVSDPNHKDNTLDLAAVQEHLGADGREIINGIEYEDGRTRLSVISSKFNFNIQLIDMALFEEAGGTLGW